VIVLLESEVSVEERSNSLTVPDEANSSWLKRAGKG